MTYLNASSSQLIKKLKLKADASDEDIQRALTEKAKKLNIAIQRKQLKEKEGK